MDLQTFLKGFDINRFGVEFKETLDSALKTLDDIKSRRKSASAMNVPADEMFEYYTYIITSLLWTSSPIYRNLVVTPKYLL